MLFQVNFSVQPKGTEKTCPWIVYTDTHKMHEGCVTDNSRPGWRHVTVASGQHNDWAWIHCSQVQWWGFLEEEHRGSRIEDRGSRIEDRGSRIEDRGSRIEDRRSTIEDRGSRIEDRRSTIDDRGSTIDDRRSGIDDRGSSENKQLFLRRK